MNIFRLLTFIIILTNYTLSFSADSSSNTAENKAIFNVVHSDEIRNIMRRIRILIYDREYTELELRKLTSKQFELLVKEVNLLTKAAANMPNIESLKILNDEEQVTFNAMANQLFEIARELQQNSETHHQASLDTSYIKLQETCNTCHEIFRNN
jgi:cytochrome c'